MVHSFLLLIHYEDKKKHNSVDPDLPASSFLISTKTCIVGTQKTKEMSPKETSF